MIDCGKLTNYEIKMRKEMGNMENKIYYRSIILIKNGNNSKLQGGNC